MKVLNARDLPGVGPSRRLPEGAVWISRRSRWGNPFRIGDTVPEIDAERFIALERPATRSDVLDLYRTWLGLKLHGDPDFLEPLRSATALVCWCAPEPCHGDIIVEYLDQWQPDLHELQGPTP